MRTAFVKTIEELAAEDGRIFWLVADLGYSMIESFAEKFPERFINVGVAEQNMIGIATGLALSGNIVFVYSIGNFPTLRCLEQIRNDICYHRANVKVVSAGGGFTYGPLGLTHHATEDIAIMRALPDMTVVAPGDPVESALITRAIARMDGPCYLRLGRANEPVVHTKTPDLEIGRSVTVRDGGDITLISTGGMLYTTLNAAEELSRQGIAAGVLSMHTIKPLDTEAVLKEARDTGKIITIEEHNIIGGLGSAVAEVIAENGKNEVVLQRLGVRDTFSAIVGSQDYLREHYGLSAEAIITAAKSLVEDKDT